MSRHQLALEKEALLREIQQQRLDLADSAARWVEVTAPFDRGWAQIVSMRKYLIAGGSLVALYSVRHPVSCSAGHDVQLAPGVPFNCFAALFYHANPFPTSLPYRYRSYCSST